MSHRGSLLCLPSGLWAWPVTTASDIDETTLEPVFAEAGTIGLFLLGYGNEVWSMPGPLRKRFREAGITLELTRTGVTMGTPYYMSPEQARGSKSVDHRVDLYAVGVILHECLTGKVPYAGENYLALVQQILRNDTPRPSNVVAGIPKELDDVVVRALSKEPGEGVQRGHCVQPDVGG